MAYLGKPAFDRGVRPMLEIVLPELQARIEELA
jgi:hypothetical protein